MCIVTHLLLGPNFTGPHTQPQCPLGAPGTVIHPQANHIGWRRQIEDGYVALKYFWVVEMGGVFFTLKGSF